MFSLASSGSSGFVYVSAANSAGRTRTPSGPIVYPPDMAGSLDTVGAGTGRVVGVAAALGRSFLQSIPAASL